MLKIKTDALNSKANIQITKTLPNNAKHNWPHNIGNIEWSKKDRINLRIPTKKIHDKTKNYWIKN